jgi:hypothetical protein
MKRGRRLGVLRRSTSGSAQSSTEEASALTATAAAIEEGSGQTAIAVSIEVASGLTATAAVSIGEA